MTGLYLAVEDLLKHPDGTADRGGNVLNYRRIGIGEIVVGVAQPARRILQ